MQIGLKLIILALLVLVAFEDHKYRAVSIWIFVLLFVVQIILKTTNQINWIQTSLFNIGFISIQLVLVSIYFSIKAKKPVNITIHLLGTGDILFFLWMATAFNTLNFIVYYFVSLLVIMLVYTLIKYKYSTTIPLAGLQAIGVAILYIIGFFGLDLIADASFLELILTKWMGLI